MDSPGRGRLLLRIVAADAPRGLIETVSKPWDLSFYLYIIGVFWYLLGGVLEWIAGALGYRAQHGLLELRSHLVIVIGSRIIRVETLALEQE